MRSTVRLVVGVALPSDPVATRSYPNGDVAVTTYAPGAVHVAESMPMLFDHDEGWKVGEVAHLQRDERGAVWCVAKLDERIGDYDLEAEPLYFSPGGRRHRRSTSDLLSEVTTWHWDEISLSPRPALGVSPVNIARVSAFGWDGFPFGTGDQTRKLIGYARRSRGQPLELEAGRSPASMRSPSPGSSPSLEDLLTGGYPVLRNRNGEQMHRRFSGEILSIR